MSKERELLKEALYVIGEFTEDAQKRGEILITEIKELLAQPEQEPDYYLWHDEVHEEHPTNEGDPDVYPLYTAPPKREPLSDEDICEILLKKEWKKGIVEFARAIEKAHGIGDK